MRGAGIACRLFPILPQSTAQTARATVQDADGVERHGPFDELVGRAGAEERRELPDPSGLFLIARAEFHANDLAAGKERRAGQTRVT